MSPSLIFSWNETFTNSAKLFAVLVAALSFFKNILKSDFKVDLSKEEQMRPEFLKMNPKHEVPVFDQNGTFVTESREIAKYFHENFNTDLEENDHWYPRDPEGRKKV